MPGYSLLQLPSEEDYRSHFETNYCKQPIKSVWGFDVYFKASDFGHAFFESSQRDGTKDVFSADRAERIDWIQHALDDPDAAWYEGWDKKTKSYVGHRPVCVVQEDFVVVIRISKNASRGVRASFVTCYKADNSIGKIRQSPLWSI